MKNLFSFDGRINRRDWWIVVCASSAIAFFVYLILIILAATFASGFMTGLVLIATIALIIVSAWISLSIGIRRWHDVGKSGWWVLISVIPFGGLYALYMCGIETGDPGPNEYGPPPEDGAAWSETSSRYQPQDAALYSPARSGQVSSSRVHPGTRTVSSNSGIAATSSAQAGSSGITPGSALISTVSDRQMADAMTMASTASQATSGHIRLGKFAPSLDVCLSESEPTVANLIFSRVRLLTLAQLNQHGMSIGHIHTNSRSDASMIFDAAIFPAGEITLTRQSTTLAQGELGDSMQLCIHLVFSDLSAPHETVNSMMNTISTNLQKEFPEFTGDVADSKASSPVPDPKVHHAY